MESKGPQVFFVAHMLFLLEADLARQLAAGGRILVDEFTSVLDRTLAAALCVSVESYVPWKGREGKGREESLLLEMFWTSSFSGFFFEIEVSV